MNSRTLFSEVTPIRSIQFNRIWFVAVKSIPLRNERYTLSRPVFSLEEVLKGLRITGMLGENWGNTSQFQEKPPGRRLQRTSVNISLLLPMETGPMGEKSVRTRSGS